MDYGSILRIGILLAAGFYGIAALKRILTRALQRLYSDSVRIPILVRVVTYLAAFIIGASILQELGINITALLGAAGILGVAIGFAAQASVSNIISGIFILIEHPFSLDDEIQIDEFTGKVVDINLFSIGLLTPDHRTIRIPHEKLLKNIIINKTNRAKRRYEIPVSVAYDEDLERVRTVFINAMRNESYCLMSPEPLIWVDSVNGDMAQLTVAVWVDSSKLMEAKQRLFGALYAACKKENIKLHQPSTLAVSVTQK
jgi:small conductance mechanosensitive channel